MSRPLLLWTFLLCACSPSAVPTELASSTDSIDAPASVTPLTPTTEVLLTQDVCAYQWAYQDLPELTGQFQESIRTIHENAQATAFAFGEDCVHPDGTRTFLPMETDFNVTYQVDDVNNEPDLGILTVRTMEVIDAIPPEQIVGPQPGRVTIVFQEGGTVSPSGDNQRNVIFLIDYYHKLPADLTPLQVFTRLKQP